MNVTRDENLGVRTRQVFLDAGHSVRTVRDEHLQGRPDEAIYDVCRIERRCLVTLDLDFSNVLRFPPEPTTGIAVVQPSGEITLLLLVLLARSLVAPLAQQSIEGQVWIIEPDRIRTHQPAPDDQL